MKSYIDSVECSAQPLDLSFHPNKDNLVAAALVDGTVEVHDLHVEQNNNNDGVGDEEHDSILSSLAIHTQVLPPKTGSKESKTASCRAVTFSVDSDVIYTGGSAGDLCALNSEYACTFTPSTTTSQRNGVLWRIDHATVAKYSPIQVLHPLEQSPHLLATGDESGGVRLWDLRLCGGGGGHETTITSSVASKRTKKQRQQLPRGCVLSWEENEDYISGIDHSEDCTTLLTTSADGRLGVFDLRKGTNSNSKQSQKSNIDEGAFRLSDDQEDELLSIQIMKHGKKVVCGTHQGVLGVFSWGTWGDVSDRFPGHPQSVDALVKIDEDTLLTGSSDGLIRVVQIQPDKLLGVISEDDHGGFPIEKLEFNCNRHVVGSISHDVHIRLCDARVLDDSHEDQEEEDDDAEDKISSSSKPLAAVAAASTKDRSNNRWTTNDSDDEWDDMKGDEVDDDSDDDVSDSSDDDDEDDKAPTKNQKRAKRLKTDNEKFFADL